MQRNNSRQQASRQPRAPAGGQRRPGVSLEQNPGEVRGRSRAAQAGARPKPGAPSRRRSPSGEFIDLNAMSDSEPESAPSVGPVRPSSNAHPNYEYDDTVAREPTVNSIETTRSSTQTAHDILHFFTRGSKKPPVSKTICKICEKEYDMDRGAFLLKIAANPKLMWQYAPGSSNNTLRFHLEQYHGDEYLRACKANGWKVQLPKQQKQEREAAVTAELGNQDEPVTPFSHEEFLTRLVNFIVADDQSINVVERREFRDLLLLLRPDLGDAGIPHRTKVREEIIKQWKEQYKILKDNLADSMGRISFTADIWSDGHRKPYLAITGHWIARELVRNTLHLRTTLLAFHRVRGPHNGENLAKIAVALLDRANITAKMGHWTLDNADNNRTFMIELGNKTKKRCIEFDPKDNRIMCFPHIINICVTHILKEFTKADLMDDTDEVIEPLDRPNYMANQTYEEACARDPLALARNIVRVLRVSIKRLDGLQKTIEKGNEEGWFVTSEGEVMTVPKRELLRDVPTRWDSVYSMIQRLQELRPAIEIFLRSPGFPELAKYIMTDREWDVLLDLQMVLEVPHSVQTSMSGEANPMLANAIPAFEMMMENWEDLREKVAEIPQIQRWINIGLKWATVYYKKMDWTNAYIIAMFINPITRMTWIEANWDDHYRANATKIVKDLMKAYHDKHVKEPTPTTPPVPEKNSLPHSRAEIRYGCPLRRTTPHAKPCTAEQSFEDEYNAYLRLPALSASTSIIKFWEMHEHIFPTIFMIAMDYLPIQASSVPSE